MMSAAVVEGCLLGKGFFLGREGFLGDVEVLEEGRYWRGGGIGELETLFCGGVFCGELELATKVRLRAGARNERGELMLFYDNGNMMFQEGECIELGEKL